MTNTAQFDALKQLLADKIGLHISGDAQNRFVHIVNERAACLGYTTLDEYLNFLMHHAASEEWETFIHAFTSGETFFFRDIGQFDLLRLHLLPELIARHRDDNTLRLWSAGCSSGEEAYSLAMLVDMLLPGHDAWKLLILGTDIDSNAIAKAQHRRYGKWSFRTLPIMLQQRYFHQEGNEWVLNERIRRMVTFRVVNLVEDAFPNAVSKTATEAELRDMDIILCRNVFIYFDRAAVSAVAAKLSATLVDGGYLMTAHTELIGHPVQGLDFRLFAEGMVYQRRVHSPAEMAPPPVLANTATLDTLPLITSTKPAAYEQVQDQETQQPSPAQKPAIALYSQARTHADRGEYALAEQMCHQALTEDSLAVPPYFLLAQLAQLKGNFEQAKAYLNKAIYLDHRCVAAYLELAALYELAKDLPQALALRHAAFKIVHSMPNNEQIELYEKTAGELKQWLVPCQP